MKAPELKHHELTLSESNAVYKNIIDSGVNCTLLNGITQGVQDVHRVANQIKMVSIAIKGSIRNLATGAAIVTGPLRTMIIYDRQGNGVVPTAAQLFDETNAQYMFASCICDSSKRRFQVIYDRLHAPGGHGFVGTKAILEQWGIVNIKCKLGLETQFNGTGSTIGDVTTGALYLVVVTDTDHWVTDGCRFYIKGQTDLKYYDV